MRLASITTTSTLSLPTDSYIYAIEQVNNQLAAISSDNSLRLLDLHTLRETPGGNLPNVHDGVTSLETVDGDPNGLLTAGRDAVVQRYDLRSMRRTTRFGHDSNAPYLSLASQGTNIAAGTELSSAQAAVLIWDLRNPSKLLQNYVESHNDDVTALHFHPTQPRSLLSGSTDGLVNLYDISISDEDDALVQVQNHGSSIHHAGFLSDSHFFALSHDETLSIYHRDDPDDSADSPPPTVFGDLRPKLDCEYTVNVIPPSTTGSGSGGSIEAIISAGSHSKQYLDLVPLRLINNNDHSFDPSRSIRLPGAHGEEIVRSIHIHAHDEDGTIFTAGEDGLVKAWRTSAGGEDEGQEPAEAERPRRAKKKRRVVGGGNELGRFKPY